MTIFTKEFWLDTAGERAVKTVAQTALATLGGGSIGIFAIDWASLASISLGAGLLSVLTSIVTKSK